MNWMPDPLLKHLRHGMQLKMVLAILLVYWICMLPSLFGNGTVSTTSVRLLLLPTLATMYWVATLLSWEMARSSQVLGHLQAPHPFRRRLLTEKLVAISITWAFISLGASVQLALPTSHAAPASGAALVSLIACLGILRVLSRTGLVQLPLAGLLSASPILLCVAVLSVGMDRFLDWFGALPFAVHALCALAFPALALTLRRRWNTELPAYRWDEKVRPTVYWLATQTRRFTILGWKEPLMGNAGSSGSLWLTFRQFSQLLFPFFLIAGRPVWENGTISVFRLMMSAFTILTVAGCVIVHDLHWRSLLQPGGLKRRRLASRIWISTFAAQLCVVALCAVAYALFASLVLGAGSDVIIGQVFAQWPLLIELMLATGVAVLLRASRLAAVLGGTAIAVAALVAIVVMLPLSGPKVVLQVPLEWYIGTSLCATAAAVALANRLWTIKRLFQETARSQAAPGMRSY